MGARCLYVTAAVAAVATAATSVVIGRVLSLCGIERNGLRDRSVGGPVGR